jgi:excisionase family DNA binding protein
MTQEENSSERPLLTVAEVGDWLKVSPSLIYQLVESGKIVVYRIGNGRGAIRFRPEDIEDYLDSCRIEKNAPPTRKTRPRLKHIHL